MTQRALLLPSLIKPSWSLTLYFNNLLQNGATWIAVRMGLVNQGDACATLDGKAMFARSKLATQDAWLMACAQMELVSAQMVTFLLTG